MTAVSTGVLTLTDVSDGLSLQLSNSSHTVPSNDVGGAPVLTGAVSSAKVLQGGVDRTSDWQIQIVASVGITGTFTNNTYTVTGLTVETATVDFVASRFGYSDLTARFTVSRTKAGAGGINVVVSNSSHTLPATHTGVVSSYANSGTTIQVFEGTVALNAASATTNTGSFTIGTPVVSPSGKLTVGGRSYAGTTATVAVHSAMDAATDSVSVTFPVSIKRRNGTTLTVNAVQSISKAKQGTPSTEPGPVGPRGTVQVYRAISGSVWVNSEADAALAGSPYNGKIIADRVTLYNSSLKWSETRYWTGTVWEVLGEVIDGNLLVTGSVTARAINTNDLFAQRITLPDSGVIRAGTTTYAEMGGDGYFTAQAGTETIFKIGKNNDHFINGQHISQTLPWQAFDGGVIPYIREQLALGTPSAGGSASGSGALTSAGVTVTTTGSIPSTGASSAITVISSYGGYSIRINSGEVGPQIPQVTVQLCRIVNDGTPVAIGALTTKSGTVSPAEPLGSGVYQWTVRVPGFNVSLIDDNPGVGNIKYQVIVTIENPPTNKLGTVNLSANQPATGVVSGTVNWSNILNKPNLSFVGHTHSAAEITSGTLAIAQGGTGRTDGKAAALATARTINGTAFDGSVAIETSYWGAARTLTIGNTGKSVNGSGNQSWTHAELGTTRNFGTVYVNPAAGSDVSATTAQFISWLTTIGALQQPSVMKCAWDYAGNNDISDTGFGALELAGCVIETFPDNGSYIIRVTSPATGAGAGGIHEYVNQGPQYSPGWRRVYTSGLNGGITGSAASIAGYNNPTTGATPNTIAYRDAQGDISARLFKSNYPAEGYFPAGSALAFRSNNTSDDYIRFCSDPAAIRNWVGANNASNITLGTLDDARLPATISRKTIVKNTITSGSADSHLELQSPDVGGGGDIALMFHQANRWYHSIRANGNGFRFTNGGNNNLERITAGLYYFGDNGGYMGAGDGGSMRVQTPTGYLDIGSQNTAYVHFQTDRAKFYFIRTIEVDGDIKIYNSSVGINTSGVYGNGSQLTNVNASLLGGYPTDNYLRFIGWSPRDANTQANMDANFTYGVNAPYPGPLIKMGASGYEIQINGQYSNTGRISFRTHNGDGPGWGNWRDFVVFEPNGYAYMRSWVNMPNDTGLFWDNGTHLRSVGNGKLRLHGGGNETWMMFAAGGDTPRGYVYADYTNQIGFLNQNGTWTLRVDAGSTVYASDFVASSDRRIKSGLEVIPNALDKVSKMTGYTYMKKGNDTRRQAGYIAQDLQAVLPEGVFEYDDVLQVSHSATIGLLLNAVNELSAEVKELKRRLH